MRPSATIEGQTGEGSAVPGSGDAATPSIVTQPGATVREGVR